MKKFFKNKKAWTLTELMLVILIIALVSSIATVSINTIRRSARDKKLLNSVLEFQLALENYKMIEGSYPSADLVTPGSQLISPNSSNIFQAKIPDNILYYHDEVNDKYKVSFELEGPIENLDSGFKCAITNNIINQSCCPSGLIAYWQADSNANDFLGNYNGVFYNSAYTTGKFGQAFSFNGSNSYIKLNNSIPFDLTYTLSLWVNFSDVTQARYFIGDASASGMPGIRYNGSSFLAYNGLNQNDFVAIPWLKQNKFVHLVIIKIDSRNYDFYINGEKIGTSYAGDGEVTMLIDLIGKRKDGNYFLGPIDDVMIFNRTLSLTEIRMLAEGKSVCYHP